MSSALRTGRWVALGVGLAALFFALGLPFIDGQGGYAGLSPRFLPTWVSIGLGACALALALSREAVPAQAEDAHTAVAPERAWSRLAWVVGGLLGHLLLIPHLGFVLAAALLMVCVARGFGSRRWLRDAAIAIAISLPIWFLFARVFQVGLKLFPPAGL